MAPGTMPDNASDTRTNRCLHESKQRGTNGLLVCVARPEARDRRAAVKGTFSQVSVHLAAIESEAAEVASLELKQAELRRLWPPDASDICDHEATRDRSQCGCN